jgi:long-chain acyl-CoA synthetase
LRQPLLAKLGLGRVRIALTGGAAVPRSLLETWRSWGLPLVELYGSAETADVAAFRPPSAAVDSPLTVLPHVRGRIADNGELQLATGPGISAAYIGADGPTDTRPAELATGDLARLDGDRLSLLGRLDNRTIVSGTAFSLDSIEAQLVDNNLARTAIVLCRDDKHAVALLELNFRELAVRARKAGVSYTSYESLVTTGFAHESCGEFVGKTNADLAAQGITGIADYRIVPRELRVESGELTATGKIRRHRIIESFGSLIDDMYTSMNVGRGSHA